MLNQFKQHITQIFPEVFTNKTLLAVSGGVDSMVLLQLFIHLKVEFAVAHCNFQLRDADSDLDEKLVTDFCNKNNITCFVKRFDTMQVVKSKNVSIQIAARELRYNWFKQLCTTNNYRFIATAHHLNDQVETFLINFTRGTGIDGLVGIPEKNQQIIRPMLPFSRDEILNFAVENGVEWREDQSNATTKYLRNKIRHLIVPVLMEENQQFLQTFQNTLHFLKQTQHLANDAMVYFENECVIKEADFVKIDLDKLQKFNNKTAYLVQFLMSYGFFSSTEIEKICVASTGKFIKNNNYTLLKNRNELLIYDEKLINKAVFFIKNENDVLQLPFFMKILRVENAEINTDKDTIFVNSELLKWPLVLRKINTADVFQPFGMKGFKKVSKFFKDEKLSKIEKDNTWLLVNGDDKIIWIVGMRADNRFKILNNSKQNHIITLKQ
ncbi:tRNA lysidine(34) synthetase TilS [Myroides sp. JBRI-B21084]|uniref:tRNA lysidine(34) synthetase TilS n=1 Tax=Myroides sp. JBRI-B21084 TaxID=3119977 RepID=UPI0026E308AB|nr:tRNA lysidine(34) synthetase TilS [Paenimyroides cloacae]WKW47564.1 tRNA lysidine(34) synthetase TilS [Paenimyroides cloacae]